MRRLYGGLGQRSSDVSPYLQFLASGLSHSFRIEACHHFKFAHGSRPVAEAFGNSPLSSMVIRT